MLAIVHRAFAHPPQELQSPADTSTAGGGVRKVPKTPDEILRAFHAAHPGAGCFSASFARGAALAYVPAADPHVPQGRRLFCAVGDVYCLFHGALDNLGALARQYGLGGRKCNEAALVIEAYRTLRDRGPVPADRAIRDLEGVFAFTVYDAATGAVFAALSSDSAIPMYWGIAADGSAVISDELNIVKTGCGKSFAPFPPGCMFHSEGGLRSFEHPTNMMRAVPRVDSEGAMCGAAFCVDPCARLPPRVPRVGSAADWAGAWGVTD